MSYNGCACTNIAELSKLHNNLVLMACDNSVCLLPNRPVDPKRLTQEISKIVLDERSYKQEQRETCTLDKRDFLRLVLRVWGRPRLLTFCVPKSVSVKQGTLGIQLKLKT